MSKPRPMGAKKPPTAESISVVLDDRAVDIDVQHFWNYALIQIVVACPICHAKGKIKHPLDHVAHTFSHLSDNELGGLLTDDARRSVREGTPLEPIPCPYCEGAGEFKGLVSMKDVAAIKLQES